MRTSVWHWNYAIDRETYNMLANSGTYTAWGNPVMPAVDGINATYGEEFQPDGYPINGDLTKAQEYLQAAMGEMGHQRSFRDYG